MIFSKVFPFNADIYTPVELYLSLRNQFRKTCLLESNDYHSRANSKSFIGLNPIIEFQLNNNVLSVNLKGKEVVKKLDKGNEFIKQLESEIHQIQFQDKEINGNGFFGRFGFEFAHLTEDFIVKQGSDLELPDLHLFVYKYVIVIDHFTDNGYVIVNDFAENELNADELFVLMKNRTYTEFPFEVLNDETADFSDNQMSEIVKNAIDSCKRGDVFQLVVSNRFQQSFFGDDFNVYRELRRLNPSPYLFYFDFENYRLFGSSPEAQLIVKEGKAEIHPIAGTVPKTGVEGVDKEKLHFLIHDEKENAEHTMLVDLARNDLSKNGERVKVEVYKEVQYFSHVIHLVSKVTAEINQKESIMTFNNTFPAGTLSGTPKPKALELISNLEKTTRDFYGGAVGILGSNGDLNMAIVIRSILSKNNELYYRAGAGVVINSIVESEVQEIHHKLRAVKTAIKNAANFNV